MFTMFKSVLFVLFGLLLGTQCQPKPATNVRKTPIAFKVSDVPEALKESPIRSSSFFGIWANRLGLQNKTGPILREKDPERPEPNTIVIPTEILLANLVPHDAPHPLYREEFPKLTNSFLLDSVTSEYVDPDDNRLVAPAGLIVKTRNGKDLIFKKEPKTNAITVNGYRVKDFHKVVGEDQLSVYVIDGVLFNYKKEISDAFEVLSQDSPSSPPRAGFH